MDLALEKLSELAQHKDDLDKQGIRVRILGNIRMLPKRLQRVAAQIMLLTRENTRATLNIMMPYTTRDELTSALDNIRRGVQSGYLHEDDISPEVIDRSSILRDCRPLDLLVRTSGEVRVSDFMLWQASRAASTFSFLTVHWPALSFWHLVVALLQFQLNRAALLPLPEYVRCHLNRSNPEPVTANGHNRKQHPIVIDVNEVEERKRRLEAFYRMLEHVYLDELIEMSKLPEGADE
nr:dehydrodolichyl diphosphate synthase [Hymenolepis microstoma]